MKDMIRYLACCLTILSLQTHAELAIDTNFPGGSAKVEMLDQATRTISITPSPRKDLGWECWWNFKLTGIEAGKPVTLVVTGMSFAIADRATISLDGKTWHHSAPGKVEKGKVTYSLTFEQDHAWIAWGPPFQLTHAEALIAKAVQHGGKAFEFCKSNGGRSVPAVRFDPATPGKYRGLWVHARQHAWESGSSWVCSGFVNWLFSDESKALRENTRIIIVPIMDVDNVEIGAGGKDQVPHDHNRDWMDKPLYAAVRTAQAMITEMNAANEFDLFIDLHNPAPRDLKPFFFVSPASIMNATQNASLQRWVETAQGFLGKHPLGLEAKTRESGSSYHPLWKQISKNWVTDHCQDHVVAVTLETAWNTPNSTQSGYQTYGSELGKAISAYLSDKR
jgi:hypothetical protein